MHVPEPLEITASLMAGYTFEDGSLLEVEQLVREEMRAARYRVTDASGQVIAEGSDLYAGAFGWEDYGEVMDDLAALLGHDGEVYDYKQRYYGDQDGSSYIWNEEVARWAFEHKDELSILSCYREDKRLAAYDS